MAVLIGIYGAWGGWNQILVAVDQWGDSAPDLKPTLDEVNKAAVKIGDEIVTTQLQERSTAPHITAAVDALKESAVHLSGTADSLSKTAAAGTGTLNAATEAIGEGQRTIAAAQPLLAAYTQSGYDLDAILKRKAIGDILDNAAGLTAQGNAISADFRQVADKAREDYLRKVPWWEKPIKYSGDIIDISAAIARHAP